MTENEKLVGRESIAVIGQAIETAAIMKCAKICNNLWDKSGDCCESSILALITPEGKTALEEFGMRVAEAVEEYSGIDHTQEQLRAIVKQVMEGEK